MTRLSGQGEKSLRAAIAYVVSEWGMAWVNGGEDRAYDYKMASHLLIHHLRDEGTCGLCARNRGVSLALARRRWDLSRRKRQ
jgi:hypothetical protein